MTQDVAAQAVPSNVLVNSVAPETILAQRNQQRIPQEPQPVLVRGTPDQRPGTFGDAARAPLFLVSDEAAWIADVILDVAGGATMDR